MAAHQMQDHQPNPLCMTDRRDTREDIRGIYDRINGVDRSIVKLVTLGKVYDDELARIEKEMDDRFNKYESDVYIKQIELLDTSIRNQAVITDRLKDIYITSGTKAKHLGDHITDIAKPVVVVLVAALIIFILNNALSNLFGKETSAVTSDVTIEHKSK